MTLPEDVIGQCRQALANIAAARPAATMLVVAGLIDPRLRIEIEVTAHRPEAFAAS